MLLVAIGVAAPAFGKDVLEKQSVEATFEGYGPVRFGEKLSAVEKTVGAKAISPPGDNEEACRSVAFKKYPNVSFMVENGVVTRADGWNGKSTVDMANAFGIKIGDSAKAVKRAHADAKSKANIYDERSPDLYFDSEDGKAAIWFEVSEGQIRSVRAGRRPSVEYAEGCS